MKQDSRSGTMVAVLNCAINHNARTMGAAHCPGINKVPAILGGDVKSPGCAGPADTTDEATRAAGHQWGIFTGMLKTELEKQGLEIYIRGIRNSAEETLRADLAWPEQRFSACS